MYPVIFQIGPFTIYSYGLMLVIAFLIGSMLASLQAKRENVNHSTTLMVDGERSRTINPDIIFNLLFIIFISGIIGARLFYVIEHINYYLKNPIEIIKLAHGGLSWFGGLLSGLLFSIIYLKKKNLSVYKIFDLISPFIALAQAIGRIGCLLNGCCYGNISKFGIYFEAHKSILIPTQVYSSLALIFVFIILRFLQDAPHKEGEIFYAYLLLYSLKRFFIEFWRADNEIILAGLTLFQIISIAVFCIAVVKLFIIRKSLFK